jgi:hypothetical protein
MTKTSYVQVCVDVQVLTGVVVVDLLLRSISSRALTRDLVDLVEAEFERPVFAAMLGRGEWVDYQKAHVPSTEGSIKFSVKPLVLLSWSMTAAVLLNSS